jgi:TonB-dependent starch-binding outer membrane protein SusC
MKKNKKAALVMTGVKKFMLTMKLCVIILLISVASVTANSGYSQSTKLTLNLKDATVRDVFDQIEQTSEFIFVFYDDIVDLDRRVNIDVEGATVDKILEKVFESTDNTFVIFDRQIVIASKGTNIIAPDETNPGNTISSQPQRKEINGRLTDMKGQPLPGVTVLLKGTTVGITTGNDGRYVLLVPNDAKTLVFSFVGMAPQELEIGNQTTINVVMVEETFGIDEVVVVGYGTVKKSDITGSLTSVNEKTIKERPVQNLIQALQGKAAGIDITSNIKPGELPQIVIRGTLHFCFQQPIVCI